MVKKAVNNGDFDELGHFKEGNKLSKGRKKGSMNKINREARELHLNALQSNIEEYTVRKSKIEDDYKYCLIHLKEIELFIGKSKYPILEDDETEEQVIIIGNRKIYF